MIPDTLARTTTERLGAVGAEWLRRLPDILAACERRWALSVGSPFALSYNFVAPALRADGTSAVLKLGYPLDKELRTEAEVLQRFAGRGVVQLLELDLDRGALLLERLEPGTPLTDLADDTEATSIAAAVMRGLRRPAPSEHSFPTVAYWASGFRRLLRDRFEGGTGPLPRALVEEAEGLFDELIATMAEPVLLHGDLHHGNILAAQRQPWLAIDPKGVVGEPEYETGALLRNPLPELLATPRPDRILARRVAQLAEELGFDRERIRGWAMAQAVLSAVWTLDDHGHGWEPALVCAEILAALKS